MGGWRILLPAMAVTLAWVAGACESDEPKAPDDTPQSVEEFFEALAYGIDRDGEVFHASVNLRVTENGTEGEWGTTEGWVDQDGEHARAHWQKGPGNTNDLAERTVQIHTPEGVYSADPGSDDDPSFLSSWESELCLPQAPSQVLALVACGFLGFGGPDFELFVEQSTFEGRATVALVGRYPVSSPVGSEEFPPGGPTPHPAISAATRGEYRLHLDATTYLPIATVSSLDSDPDRRVFGAVSLFTVEFVDRSSLPKDWFEPRSIGYVPPDERELRTLDRPDLQAPVYWLGRTFNPGGGLPVLGDLYVNEYGPRPSRGDEPNIQLGLSYRGDGGAVRLDIYPPGDWEAFKARLGGNFPWTWCAEAREFNAGGARVTILAGYEAFPYRPDFGAVTVIPVTPGQDPPTPVPATLTVPRIKTEPCPGTPHDRFMAEVRFSDATIVINGTLGYGGQEGLPWGVFDTAEALEAIARGLHQRRPGE